MGGSRGGYGGGDVKVLRLRAVRRGGAHRVVGRHVVQERVRLHARGRAASESTRRATERSIGRGRVSKVHSRQPGQWRVRVRVRTVARCSECVAVRRWVGSTDDRAASGVGLLIGSAVGRRVRAGRGRWRRRAPEEPVPAGCPRSAMSAASGVCCRARARPTRAVVSASSASPTMGARGVDWANGPVRGCGRARCTGARVVVATEDKAQ